jgi:hypothetical protein
MTKRKKSFKPINLFHTRQTVQYQAQLNLHETALRAIRKVLPEALALKTHACVINDRKLLIYSHSATWASQLRFYSQELQAAVSSATSRPIEKVQIRILQPTQAKQEENPGVKIPAKESIDLIRENALSAPNSLLKTALLKLSLTLKRRYEDI